ncbi:hypothetical protein [Sphaerisporangium perillae]|uniref:hypothetical protein n=1 Tax=Sphaerisporangium perillae TaxID=2935860 RepID=UPI00200C665A|nr:hypothetical protein [Sphaerisporangium perillae]
MSGFFAVPYTILWFTGVAMAAITISALVPAAIMSIAAANLVSRNIYREFVKPDANSRQELRVSRVTSFLVKFGALAFVLFLDRRFAPEFQLLGGVWIVQTFPAVVFGLYTRWFHPGALLAGWATGMLSGTLTNSAGDYLADVGDPHVEPIRELRR